MTDFRLDKKLIISANQRFNKIFKSGRRFSSRHFLLIVVTAEDKKIGFAVSKKTRGAIKRNRARRRMKETIRLNQKCLPDKSNVILMAKPGVERVQYKLLSEELIGLFCKLDPKRE
ncbi:MAG: ribonuclease P protein component [Nitrospinales bacterium]